MTTAQAAPPTTGLRAQWPWSLFPLAVAVVFAVLVALDLSGSSIALLTRPEYRVGLLAGEPRPIRSDEFLLRTPIALSSASQGFPTTTWIGLSQIDQAATAHGGPTLDWSSAFKPQDWGYLTLGASRGLAWSWWWSFAVSLWGCYGLFGVLTRRPGRAALLAIVATFTPYAAWWSAPPPALFLGYAAGIGALLVGSWTAARRLAAAALAVAAGAVGVAFAVALYPPWQVSLVWVVALGCLGLALDRRLRWARIGWTTGAAAAVAGGVTLLWYLSHRAAITAVTATAYPGHRVSTAGGGDLASLLSAPLAPWLAGDAGDTLGTTPGAGAYSNLSESASSWLSLPVLALGALGGGVLLVRRLTRGRAESDPDAEPGAVWTLLTTSMAAALLLAWAFLPLPEVFGSVSLLNRVQPSRVALALGLAALLQVAAVAAVRQRPGVWSVPWMLGASVLTGVTTLWPLYRLPWESSLVPAALAVGAGVFLGACFCLMQHPRWATIGAAAAAVVALVTWALVNPLQQGLGPVDNDPLVRELRSEVVGSGNPRVVVFGTLTVVAKVRAAGLQSVSGTTLYPDAALMTELTPGQDELWNNYAQYRWWPGPTGGRAQITQTRGTSMDLLIDPCDPVLLKVVDPGWVVSDGPLPPASCVTLHGTVPTTRLAIYRVND